MVRSALVAQHHMASVGQYAVGEDRRPAIKIERERLSEFGRGCIQNNSGRKQGGEPRRRRVCRSEEHTSELQSLMRISYAVFCLKKKKTQIHDTHIHKKVNHKSKIERICIEHIIYIQSS